MPGSDKKSCDRPTLIGPNRHRMKKIPVPRMFGIAPMEKVLLPGLEPAVGIGGSWMSVMTLTFGVSTARTSFLPVLAAVLLLSSGATTVARPARNALGA